MHPFDDAAYVECGAQSFDVPWRNEQAGLLVHDEVEQAADSPRDHGPAVGHRLRDHPAKNFFPTRELANHISGGKNSFAERIFNHACPGNMISNSERIRVLHVLLAINAVADQHELHGTVLREH